MRRVFLLEIRTIIITLGLSFDLIGGILLASEMIGLLDKMRYWNSSLQNKIKSAAINFAWIGLTAGLLYLLADYIKKGSFKNLVFFLISILSLYLLIFINRINIKSLDFLENLTKKLGTERVLGLIGVIFLCLGFISQAIVNFMAT